MAPGDLGDRAAAAVNLRQQCRLLGIAVPAPAFRADNLDVGHDKAPSGLQKETAPLIPCRRDNRNACQAGRLRFGKGYDAGSIADLLKEAGIEYSKAAIVRLLPLKDGRDRQKRPAKNTGINAAQAAQTDNVGKVHSSRLHQELPDGVRTI